MGFAPTDEQQAAIEAFRTGENLVLEAAAGTGKTSTLRLLGDVFPEKDGLYLAFNKAVQVEAAASFPANVRCSTVHALAYGVVMDHGRRAKMGGPRQWSRDVAKILGVSGPHRVSADKVLAPNQVARLALETVGRFCHSASDDIQPKHVPHQIGVETPDEQANLALIVLPLARRLWRDVLSPSGRIKYQHDYYVKEWQLSHPTLNTDFVFVDEAQDSDPVLVDVVNRQTGTQIISVGDRNQAIYGWRGAIDAMDMFGAKHHLYLTQSFRFGEAIATEANLWLDELDAEIRVKGLPSIASRVDPDMVKPSAVLCRTNAGALESAMQYIARDMRPAIVGGASQMAALAKAALDLRQSGSTQHPDLCAFTSWAQVQEFIEEDGGDLSTFVRLVDNYGPEAIIEAASSTVDEADADVTISTAHKAKGREWEHVQIHSDFKEPKREKDGAPGQVAPADAMLAYVSVTRAKQSLDLGGLAWLRSHQEAHRVHQIHTDALRV
jgi:superfamily I DNA/RNA helicase